MIKVDQDILKKVYTKRDKESKKYDFGIVLIIGGSQFYTGSPALSGLAAFRAGADMIKIIAPKRAADIIASFSPNLAAYPLKSEQLSEKNLSLLLSMTEAVRVSARGAESVVIGGGTGRAEEVQNTILQYLEEIKIPVVIDADAIHAVAKKKEVLQGRSFLLTPNLNEFFVLTGKQVENLSVEKKAEIVREQANLLQTTILLKGSSDIISDGQQVAVSEIGSPYLTIGGAGDVLAGICGALLAKGNSIFESAQAAAYINSSVGKSLEEELGYSMMATDIIENISKFINKLK